MVLGVGCTHHAGPDLQLWPPVSIPLASFHLMTIGCLCWKIDDCCHPSRCVTQRHKRGVTEHLWQVQTDGELAVSPGAGRQVPCAGPRGTQLPRLGMRSSAGCQGPCSFPIIVVAMLTLLLALKERKSRREEGRRREEGERSGSHCLLGEPTWEGSSLTKLCNHSDQLLQFTWHQGCSWGAPEVAPCCSTSPTCPEPLTEANM